MKVFKSTPVVRKPKLPRKSSPPSTNVMAISTNGLEMSLSSETEPTSSSQATTRESKVIKFHSLSSPNLHSLESSEIKPSNYLQKILISRGYDLKPISGLQSSYHIIPTSMQIRSYDNLLLDAIRQNNLRSLSELYHNGVLLSACNQFCESILHYAARKSKVEIVKFLLDHGAFCFVDDGGRLPMHDACWRTNVAFDVVTVFLEHDIRMLHIQDRFGACPLDYINPRHWKDWCIYLDSIKDKYWPVLPVQNSPEDSSPPLNVE